MAPPPGREPEAQPLSPDVIVTFTELTAKVISKKCIECHDSFYPNLTGLDIYGVFPLLIPGNPADSYLYKILKQGYMPNERPPLDALELSMFNNWILQGALDN